MVDVDHDGDGVRGIKKVLGIEEDGNTPLLVGLFKGQAKVLGLSDLEKTKKDQKKKKKRKKKREDKQEGHRGS